MDSLVLAALLVCGCAMVGVLIAVASDDSRRFVGEQSSTRTAFHRAFLTVMWTGFVVAVVIIVLAIMVLTR